METNWYLVHSQLFMSAFCSLCHCSKSVQSKVDSILVSIQSRIPPLFCQKLPYNISLLFQSVDFVKKVYTNQRYVSCSRLYVEKLSRNYDLWIDLYVTGIIQGKEFMIRWKWLIYWWTGLVPGDKVNTSNLHHEAFFCSSVWCLTAGRLNTAFLWAPTVIMFI